MWGYGNLSYSRRRTAIPAINKIALFLLIALCSAIGPFNTCRAAANIALGKPYVIFPKPNYSLSAPPADTTSLTDGRYTIGYFWTQKTTVGWQKAKMIEVLIDLNKEHLIEGITFSTARGERAGVEYPSHIAAFVGPDKEHMLYVGDIAKEPSNVSGPYQLHKFALNGIGARGRFILLEIQPHGVFAFCDEIEVFEGNQEKRKPGVQTINEIRTLCAQLSKVDIDKFMLNNLAEDIKVRTAQWPQLTSRLNGIERRIQEADATFADIETTIKSDLFALRGEVLRRQFPGKEFLVYAINPWAKVSPLYPASGASLEEIPLIMPVGGCDYGSFMITNVSTRPQVIAFSFETGPFDLPEVSLYEIPFVKSSAMEYVADPLVPLKGGISLLPGESRMVLIQAVGSRRGIWRRKLSIVGGHSKVSISLQLHVANTALPRALSLNTVNWSYLDFELTKNRKAAALRDLAAHHVNVIVVPPDYLSVPEAANDPYFFRLENYLKLHKGASKILLFADFSKETRSTAGNRYPFMKAAWQEWFLKWYEKVAKASARAGFSQDHLYLYPFDEVQGSQADMLISLSSWLRKEIPSVRLYTTIWQADSLRVLPYVNIAQIHERLIENIGVTRTELWLYGTRTPAKSNSPYSYYRMMAWKAFLRGYRGVGFWAYADAGWENNPGTAWDDFDGAYPDFAVIYEGEGNSIISSRRWEAWRMGIEDYELLTMYGRTMGSEAAKSLARIVVEHPDDPSKSDEVRRRILTELSDARNN